jgi:parvulin-like peptidyl-prolyl isomerase
VRRAFKVAAVVAFVAALPFILTGCGPSKANGKADVAATVNGKEITLAEVDRLINQQTQGQQLPTLQLAAARIQALDNLVQREAVFLRAEKEKTVPSDDEVTTTVNSRKSQMTAEEWQKFLKDNNLTEEQLREEARKDLAISKLQDKLFGKITIREQEITDFYNSNREQFVNPRGVGLADIVTDPRDSGGVYQDDAKSDAEAKAKIDRLYQTLRQGADFAEVARSSSEDQGSVRGGDIGTANEETLRQNGFPQDLIAKLFGPMPIGSYTEPMHFPDGRWIIFKLTARQLENKPLTLDDPGVRDQIKQALIEQRQSILQQALVRNAMSDATVVNKLAESMLNDPNMLGGLQPVTPGASPAPAGAASPAATPAAAATTAPTAAATPAAAAKPTAAATPRPQPTHAAAPAAGASPKR